MTSPLDPVFVGLTDGLRKAFGPATAFHKVPAGMAVATPCLRGDGDRYGFYVIDRGRGRFRVEDDGLTLSEAQARGAELLDAADRPTPALQRLLVDHRVGVEDLVLMIDDLADIQVAKSAVALVALLRRLAETTT